MLNKKEVQQAGYEVIDSAAKLPAEQAEKVSQIKSILPSLVNGDGMVSVAALKDLLGEAKFGLIQSGLFAQFCRQGFSKDKGRRADRKMPQNRGKAVRKFRRHRKLNHPWRQFGCVENFAPKLYGQN